MNEDRAQLMRDVFIGGKICRVMIWVPSELLRFGGKDVEGIVERDFSNEISKQENRIKFVRG